MAFDVLSGGGATAAVEQTNRRGTVGLSGGGHCTATVVSVQPNHLDLPGGGDLSGAGTKHPVGSVTVEINDLILAITSYGADYVIALSGGGDIFFASGGPGSAGHKGARGHLVEPPQGGNITLTVDRRSYDTLAITGGGAIALAGHKAAIAFGSDGNPPLLSGGGHLWGPYPWALSPDVQVLGGDRVAIVLLPAATAGSVQLLTPDRTAQVQLVSVHGLEMTRTGS